MNIQEMFAAGGGVLFALLTLIQITPIQVNPWSALAKVIGRAINADVLQEIEEIKQGQKLNQQRLEAHVRADDERDADYHRARILAFNEELIRERRHTRESFIEILSEIDVYEHYCSEHPDYPNNRAVCAIDNIKRVYKERLEKHDFLKE